MRALILAVLFGSGFILLFSGWFALSAAGPGVWVVKTEIIDEIKPGLEARLSVRIVNTSPFRRLFALGSGGCTAKPVLSTVAPFSGITLQTAAFYSPEESAYVGHVMSETGKVKVVVAAQSVSDKITGGIR